MFTFAVLAMTIGTAVIGYMPDGRYFTCFLVITTLLLRAILKVRW